jgi:hypothetical protein
MDQRFLKSLALQKQVQGVWSKGDVFSGKKAIEGKSLTDVLNSVKAATDKIRARGGQVLFVRTPSGSPYREAEQKYYPRALYWDRLLTHTQTPGIHYEDYPVLSKYTFPEWSHLTPPDAVTFTRDLIQIIQDKTGWKITAKTVVPNPHIAASTAKLK